MRLKKEFILSSSYDLSVTNTYFRKREEHYITYKSGGNKSQINYFMWKRESLKQIKDYKVISDESLITQHNFVGNVLVM